MTTVRSPPDGAPAPGSGRACSPELIETAIVHEPIALQFLAPADADDARATLQGVRRVHQRDGWRAAAVEVAAALGIDPHNQETEPDVTQFPFTEQRGANFERFLTSDLDAALTDTLRLADIPRDGRIIPAVGTTSPKDGFDYLASLALVDHIGVPVQALPGGHNGNLTHQIHAKDVPSAVGLGTKV